MHYISRILWCLCTSLGDMVNILVQLLLPPLYISFYNLLGSLYIETHTHTELIHLQVMKLCI